MPRLTSTLPEDERRQYERDRKKRWRTRARANSRTFEQEFAAIKRGNKPKNPKLVRAGKKKGQTSQARVGPKLPNPPSPSTSETLVAQPRVPGHVVSRKELIVRRLISLDDAKTRLLPFVRLTMPVPDWPDDPGVSLYLTKRFHEVIAVALEEVEAGRMARLAIQLPPRHGKTELASKRFLPWYVGRNPFDSAIFATYNASYAQDIGRAARDVFNHPAYKQVFPNTQLREDSQAANRLQIVRDGTPGGILAFVGRGGTTTGRGGDLLLIDDPLKDRKEADSPVIRESLWTWFTQVISPRLMTDTGRIVLIGTRWHSDDLFGRLLDPTNDFYDRQEAGRWKVIDLPAEALDHDVLGRKKGEPLWPERFGKTYLASMRRQDPRGFSALYQGRPSPKGGAFFQESWLRTYKTSNLPTGLRYYAASDHAVSMAKGSDNTCLIVVGISPNDDIYVLPDIVWRQMTAEKQVDAMIRLMRKYRPTFWWAEKSMISKSLGPFLRKRMLEQHVFCSMIEMTPIADKEQRAQSIQGRMGMGKVYFPINAPWWPQARDELLKFPTAQHDDFVDTMAYIGLGLQLQVPVRMGPKSTEPQEGTFAYMKAQRKQAERTVVMRAAAGGW